MKLVVSDGGVLNLNHVDGPYSPHAEPQRFIALSVQPGSDRHHPIGIWLTREELAALIGAATELLGKGM